MGGRRERDDAEARHVVILGASVAGLLSAAAVSPYATRVTVVDRDDLEVDLVAPREGTPQAGHSHAILMGGVVAMDEILPGFADSLVEDGALLVDVLGRTRWLVERHELVRPASRDSWMLGSRTLLESRLRRRVRSLPNVSLLGGLDIVGLQWADDMGRITGVDVCARNDGTPGPQHTMPADLVIDATGRAPRSLAWLKTAGFTEPPETVVDARVSYVTRRFHDRPGLLDDLDAEIVGPHVGSRRCGIALRQENGTWTVTLVGRFGEHPPLELDGFRTFAHSLPGSAIATVADGCEPATEPLRATFPASRWRHWEKLSDLPRGLVIVGDAVASVNPAVGQGMSMSALQVRAFARLLAKNGLDDIDMRTAHSFAKAVEGPWFMGTSSDSATLGSGSTSLMDRVLEIYLDRTIALGAQLPQVALPLIRVLHLVDSPTSLLHPRIAWAVLGPTSRRRLAHAETSRASLAEMGDDPVAASTDARDGAHGS